MIYTSYFANIRNFPDNIIPVSITAQPIRGWAGVEYKKLAPPKSLLFEWKRHRNNDLYIEKYQKFVLNKLNPQEVIEELNKISKDNDGKDIALVCYEVPKDFCHRHLAADWLNQNGCNVQEFVKR